MKQVQKEQKELWVVAATSEDELMEKIKQIFSLRTVKICKVKTVNKKKRNLVIQVLEGLKVDLKFDWNEEIPMENNQV